LFDGPQQATGFVEVSIVGPGVEGGKALLSSPRSAAAIMDTIRTSRVPSHSGKEEEFRKRWIKKSSNERLEFSWPFSPQLNIMQRT
jgi:hypothetical protein